ncbi:MAG: (Fe-S)-binding protein [Gammaproteobacteria bacterium]|nr:(Fe-S)-binding protein [Gammaproteobacteria bacterium]MCB1872498.1 (Fe-S)-binding protein [Gammaproteobacteria bacterium]
MSKATLERGLNAFREQVDAPVAAFFSSCVSCGICAEACLFYTETGDPKYTPIRKLEPLRRVWEQEYTLVGKLKKVVGLAAPVTDELLQEWQELLYDSCTLCGRCSMVCPVGNDIAYMVRRAREGMVASGNSPKDVQAAAERAVRIGSPMGIKYKALAAQVKHIEADSGLTIPIDVEGADYMPLLSSMEVINFPEYIESLARIFTHAGLSWTLCSEAFEATNTGIQIGSSDIARELVQRIVDGAEKLKVKYVIAPECGHAYTSIRWEGPDLIGKPFPFKVLHILELLDELRASGRIKTENPSHERMTFHDPCSIGRKGGVIDAPRRLMQMVNSNFVEMQDHGKWNWCCGGGGGVSANTEAEALRLKVFKRKKNQIEETGADKLVTACANCRLVIEEGLEEYRVELPVEGLTELVARHLVEDK